MDDQSETLRFLADPASHGLAGCEVARIDTHSSSIFLAGDRAYKLKRAVRFSYLDYGTVERRERACRDELALNRRTAPMLYMGVRAVTREGDGTLVFDGAGQAVDWVVEMRRFDAAGLLETMAKEHRLTPPLMRALADVIAAFHAAAEPDSEAGGAAGIAAVIAGNDDNLRAAGAALDQEKIAALGAASRAALANNAALLDRRRGEGKARRCHGDLHLGNICLIDGRPVLFDAIEFSAAIATIDVVYDLAFLLMDLASRDLADLASLVFNRYLDRSGEDDALAALPLFLSLRAAIRAHVTVAAAGRHADGADTDRLLAVASRHLDLARDLLHPGRSRIIAIGGRSGSGKSTLARALAAEFLPAPGARILRSDVLRKTLLGLAPEERAPPEAYDLATNRKVYGLLRDMAVRVAGAGYCAIVDAVFLDPTERAALSEAASAAGIAFTGIWLEAPGEVMAERIAARRGDASDADIAVLEFQRTRNPGPLDGWRPVDSGGDFARSLTALRDATRPDAGPSS